MPRSSGSLGTFPRAPAKVFGRPMRWSKRATTIPAFLLALLPSATRTQAPLTKIGPAFHAAHAFRPPSKESAHQWS